MVREYDLPSQANTAKNIASGRERGKGYHLFVHRGDPEAVGPFIRESFGAGEDEFTIDRRPEHRINLIPLKPWRDLMFPLCPGVSDFMGGGFEKRPMTYESVRSANFLYASSPCR